MADPDLLGLVRPSKYDDHKASAILESRAVGRDWIYADEVQDLVAGLLRRAESTVVSGKALDNYDPDAAAETPRN